MSPSDRDDEILEQLLKAAKNDATLATIQDLLDDTGHVTDEVLDRFLQEELKPDEQDAIRRHVVFCESCSSEVVRRGGEVAALEEAEAQTVQPILAPRGALILCGLVFLGLAILTWQLFSNKEDDADRAMAEPSQMVGSPALMPASGVELPLKAGDRHRIQIPISDDLGERYVYVIFLEAGGSAQPAFPELSGFSTPLTPDNGRLVVPVPNTPPLRLATLKGETPAAYFVVCSMKRISVLESGQRMTALRSLGTEAMAQGAGKGKLILQHFRKALQRIAPESTVHQLDI